MLLNELKKDAKQARESLAVLAREKHSRNVRGAGMDEQLDEELSLAQQVLSAAQKAYVDEKVRIRSHPAE